MTSNAELLKAINEARKRESLVPISAVRLNQILSALATFEAALAAVADPYQYQLRVKLHGMSLPTNDEPIVSYVCKHCGSANVEHAFWADPNTEEVTGDFGTWNYDDVRHCSDCSENYELVDPDDFRKALPRPMRARYKDGVRLSDKDLAKLHGDES